MHPRPLAFVTAAVASLALVGGVACSNDDPSPVSGGGTDEAYVANLCKAVLDLQHALEDVDTTDFFGDEAEAMKMIAAPFEDFRNTMASADPPADIKEYHDKSIAGYDALVKALRDGDQQALDTLAGAPFEDAPQEVKDRLDKVARENQDCQEGEFTFSEG